jgi:hypothetical protein
MSKAAGDGNHPNISASDNAVTDGSGASGARIAHHQKETQREVRRTSIV